MIPEIPTTGKRAPEKSQRLSLDFFPSNLPPGVKLFSLGQMWHFFYYMIPWIWKWEGRIHGCTEYSLNREEALWQSSCFFYLGLERIIRGARPMQEKDPMDD